MLDCLNISRRLGFAFVVRNVAAAAVMVANGVSLAMIQLAGAFAAFRIGKENGGSGTAHGDWHAPAALPEPKRRRAA